MQRETTLQILRRLNPDAILSTSAAVNQKSINMLATNPVNVMLGVGLPVYPDVNTQWNVNAYVNTVSLYSIVRRIAKTAARVNRKVMIVKSEKALKAWQFYSKSVTTWTTVEIAKWQRLRSKALEDAPEGNDLQLFLDNPNPESSASEFYEGIYSFRLLTGNTYIYTPRFEFGTNKGRPMEMWILPSQYMSLQVSQSYPRRTLAYRLMITQLVVYAKDQVMHLKYFNPLYNYVGNELLGLSPVTVAAKLVAEEDAMQDYSVNSFQNSGISGIVSNESIQPDDLSVEAAGKLKSDFYRDASGVTNANKLLFSGGKINYTAIGLSPVDMNIIEKRKMTLKDWCNIFGLSDKLFNADGVGQGIGGTTENFIKDLYTNAVLPECNALDDVLNMSVAPAFSTDKIKYFITSDLSDISELQDDQKQMAEVYSTLPIMNPFLIATAMGMDTSGLENKWYLKNGYTSQDEMGLVQDLPVVTGGGN